MSVPMRPGNNVVPTIRRGTAPRVPAAVWGNSGTQPEATRSTAETATATARLSSLDAWRGLTILLMLLVNNVTLDVLTPRQLQHAPWGGGITLTDLVFPWFLFCAGAAIPFSLAASQKAGFTGWRLVGKLAWRTVLLYLVGCLLTSAENGQLTFGLGVLQLIALGSFFGGVISQLGMRWRLAIAAALLVGYDLFLSHTGVFTEKVNAAQAVNDAFLSPMGLRGLLSVIPATALVLLGSVVAQPLKNRSKSAPWLLLALGLGMTALGWGWSQHLEFNKAVWTPSYVVFTAGLGTLGMLAFWLLADSGRPWTAWGQKLLTPLTIPGRNSLFAYVAPILFKLWILMGLNVAWTGKSLPIRDALVAMARGQYGTWGGGWLYTLGYILAVWLGLAYLAKRGWTWKL